MSTLGERLDAAIKASGRTADEIARAAKITPDTISRLRTGKYDNPELQLLIRVAREAKTTVGGLLGESRDISAEDEQELLRFRGWIDEKLATIDARQEPNATIVETRAPSTARESRVADRPRQAPTVATPFGRDVHLVLRAIGPSMTGAGILDGDTLYAAAPRPAAAVAGSKAVIACRLGDAVFVKRLVTEHRRLFLLSDHARYAPIALGANPEGFEILGIITGRTGPIL
jgi:transcriptional regulator with XRE-family HTH domain